jgi:predicted acylesterase/phospholipase RssA
MLFDLVLDCGGVRGVAFIGALEALADGGHEFDRLMGTSIGGLVAAMLATGHSARSIRDFVVDEESGRLSITNVLTPYPPFTPEEIRDSATRALLRDIDFSFVPDLFEGASDDILARALMNRGRFYELFSILERMSVRQDAQFMDWLSDLFNTHAGGEDWAAMGLKELFQRTGHSLTVIASDISTASMLVLNHSTAPDLPLKWAARMTTNVPYLFPPIAWQPEWGRYRQRRLEDHLIVDGGLLAEFPIEFFLSPQKEMQEIMGERKAGNNVLGLLLDEFKRVPGLDISATGNRLYSHLAGVSKDSTGGDSAADIQTRLDAIPGVRFSRLLFDTMLTNSRKSAISPLESHIIRLPVMGIDAYAFNVRTEGLTPYIVAAYNETQDFLRDWAEDSRPKLSSLQEQYAQVVAEKFVVMGDYISVGDIDDATGVSIGSGASAVVSKDNKS